MTLYPKDSHNSDVADGAIRWNGSAFEGRISGAWVPLGGGGAADVVSLKTGDYVVLAGDAQLTCFVGSSAVPMTFTLEAAPVDNRVLSFKSIGAGAVTVAGNGNNIDGVAEQVLGQYDAIKVIYELANTRWHII